MISVTKCFEFEAAHCLPDHKGKCKHVHGHSYRLEVEISLEDKKFNALESGILVDFSDLEKLVKVYVVDRLDHTMLNDFFGTMIPSAENMVMWIKTTIQSVLEGHFTVERVRLWETSTSYAEWRR